MDAIFTPVPKVKYSIEPCRVGQRNDYDKLVLEIWTDGTISPVNALGEAAKIAKDHFAIFINFNDSEISGGDEGDEGDERIKQILETPVEELELSVRSKSLQEIKEKLQEWNLTLGMTDYSHLKNAANIIKQKEENDES